MCRETYFCYLFIICFCCVNLHLQCYSYSFRPNLYLIYRVWVCLLPKMTVSRNYFVICADTFFLTFNQILFLYLYYFFFIGLTLTNGNLWTTYFKLFRICSLKKIFIIMFRREICWNPKQWDLIRILMTLSIQMNFTTLSTPLSPYRKAKSNFYEVHNFLCYNQAHFCFFLFLYLASNSFVILRLVKWHI